MTHGSALLQASVLAMCVAPLALLVLLALSALIHRPLSERAVGGVMRLVLIASLVAAVTALASHLIGGAGPVVLSFGSWFSYGHGDFSLELLIDGRTLGFATLAIGICNVVAAFSFRYLHREPGYRRYFAQLAMFVVGITLVALAGTVEVLFVGWELLGLSSALLVGFFHERTAPLRNGLRVFAVYRVSDAAMLSAAVLLHYYAGSGSLSLLFSSDSSAIVELGAARSLAIAVLVIVAVAGKSALWPFSGWLPRAMEGPTPSSAVYYGALSIHAGCFLLLRAEPLLAQSPVARGLAVAAGVATAVFAALIARVQSDVKSALSYAALTQVGIIVVEISLGLSTLAFVHMVGHACFRLLQFLSAPNILHDLHELENRLGGHVAEVSGGRGPRAGSRALYLAALERGFADSLLDRLVVRPFAWVAARLDRLDRRLVPSGRATGGGDR